jgi:DNA-binding cell septation regulator SpoVG
MNTLPKLDARVRLHRDQSDRPTKVMAFVDLLIADAFVIKGIRVLAKEEPGADEPFVTFPAEKGRGLTADRWFDIAHPVTPAARAAATGLILAEYAKVKAGARP